ncbi:MAG: Gfo/Idh/MocA family oxidoreductase [Planctomycetes bacterium]|nr:Gfo/Idh/MocA family oxidoreductase [Planctomycetota bacterium]
MNASKSITIPVALVGGGMFGGDVVLRAIEDLERCGLAPYLGRVGLDHLAADTFGVGFRLVAIGTRTRETASRLSELYRQRLPGAAPQPFWGEAPWEDIFRLGPAPKILFVATPDPLHAAPVLCAIEHGAHAMVEKPLALRLEEADRILAAARRRNRVVGVDMHKRYDPCHRFLFEELVPKIGKPLYGRAVLEEPIEVSTRTFKWAARSNPFSYVGIHWLDLFGHYLKIRPASVHAVGQKELLARWDREAPGQKPIDAFDAMQVSVDYREGLRVYYVNSWINPREFEGPVNQEMEIAGTLGKIEFDQQYRGLRATIAGVGSRTFNPHFTADVRRLPGGPAGGASGSPLPPAYDGYGKDSIVVIVERAVRVELGLARREELGGTYPDLESSRSSVAVLEAAEAVALRNLAHSQAGRGAPVTARLSEQGIEILDPLEDDPRKRRERIYTGNIY